MSQLFDLTGRVALVTGAGGRLGRAFALALADAGADVVLTGRDESRLAETAGELGERALVTLPMDVTGDAAADELFDAVDERVGRLDILVNSAGSGRNAPFGDVRTADLEELFSLNVAAPYLCAQRAAVSMRRVGGGKIVNVGSIYGSVAVDTRIYDDAEGMVSASPAYVASKSALVNLTRELAVRLAPHGIQVNMLSPGGVEAGQPEPFRRAYAGRTPAARMGTPQDLIGTLVYLCSPASDYVTGQNILVDGGFTAW